MQFETSSISFFLEVNQVCDSGLVGHLHGAKHAGSGVSSPRQHIPFLCGDVVFCSGQPLGAFSFLKPCQLLETTANIWGVFQLTCKRRLSFSNTLPPFDQEKHSKIAQRPHHLWLVYSTKWELELEVLRNLSATQRTMRSAV